MTWKWLTNLTDSLRAALKIPSIYIDGGLYISLGVFGFLQAQLGLDEAAKYVEPVLLYWLKIFVGVVLQATLALKLFRSGSWSKHKEQRQREEDTKLFAVKPKETP